MVSGRECGHWRQTGFLFPARDPARRTHVTPRESRDPVRGARPRARHAPAQRRLLRLQNESCVTCVAGPLPGAAENQARGEQRRARRRPAVTAGRPHATSGGRGAQVQCASRGHTVRAGACPVSLTTPSRVSSNFIGHCFKVLRAVELPPYVFL